ncbi:hypothetical protein [Streptomyces sp. BBFR102]|uniref:hypothetical protein n=1 Tax=Streptomyces sp. BBFR102 TaxID=3448171 RepID=UPI003F52E79D
MRVGRAELAAAVRPLVTGARGRLVFEGGGLDAGIWSVGPSQGLIRDVAPAGELVRRTVAEAREVIHRTAAQWA